MTNKLQYSLKLKVLTHVSVVHQLTEHEVINKITFSTIHDLPLLARLSTEQVSRLLSAAFEDFAELFAWKYV